MPTSNWGIVTADGSDAGNVPVSMAAMQASIEGRVVCRFATVAARATATSAFLALFPGTTGMAAYVVDRGQCVYDANARSGSGGWTWLSAPVTLLTASPAGSSSGAWVTVASGGAYNLNHGSHNRLIRVNMSVTLWNASGSITSAMSPAKADMIVGRNGSEVQQTRVSAIILPHGTGAGQIASTASEVTGASTYDFVWSGASNLDVRIRRDGGTGGSVSGSAYLQVIDLGPAD